MDVVVGYTVLHFAAFAVFGIVVATSSWLPRGSRDSCWSSRILFLRFQLFFGFLQALDEHLVGALAWWTVHFGNLLASVVIIVTSLPRPPRPRHPPPRRAGPRTDPTPARPLLGERAGPAVLLSASAMPGGERLRCRCRSARAGRPGDLAVDGDRDAALEMRCERRMELAELPERLVHGRC